MKKTLFVPKQRGGHVTHYHHFLYGYYLPILLEPEILNNLGEEKYVFNCDNMNKIFEQTPKINFGIIEEARPDGNKLDVAQTVLDQFDCKTPKAFDGHGYDIPKVMIENLNKVVDKIYDIKNSTDEYILLIDRGRTPTKSKQDEFDNLDSRYTFGNQRRTISNIDEVHQHLKNIMPTKRVRLENWSLKDQIVLFRNAKYIVAQHGAGLSNAIFVSDKCKGVVEFSTKYIPRQREWFSKLFSNLSIKHIKIVSQEQHINIDLDRFQRVTKNLF